MFVDLQLLCAVKQSHEHGICHGEIVPYLIFFTSQIFILLEKFILKLF